MRIQSSNCCTCADAAFCVV